MLKSRPLSVPFPYIWSKFERIKNGKVYKFEVREADENEIDDLIAFMVKNFMRDETWNSAVGIAKDPLAIEEFQILFRYILNFNYHLVCYDVTDPTKPRIASCNALLHITNGDDSAWALQYSSTAITKLLQIFDEVKEAVDLCEKYGVKEYLNGAGLSTDPDYRGMGLAYEVLRARDPMCKAFGFKLTAAAFTGIASQTIAEKCGYQTAAEFDYAKLGEKLNVQFDPKTKTCKIMVYLFE